jgi:hypothetical protein
VTGEQPQATVFERGSKVHEYWLAHAEGFHVVSRRKPRDRVDHVVVDRERGSATALVVRRRHGRRPKRIPVMSVSAVDPFERLLYLTPQRRARSTATDRGRRHVAHAIASALCAQRAALAWLRPRAIGAAYAVRLGLVRAALWLRPHLVETGRRTTVAYTRGYHASRTFSRDAYAWVQPRIVTLVRRAARAVRSAPNGIRTRATALKGPRPGPLVDGGEKPGQVTGT